MPRREKRSNFSTTRTEPRYFPASISAINRPSLPPERWSPFEAERPSSVKVSTSSMSRHSRLLRWTWAVISSRCRLMVEPFPCSSLLNLMYARAFFIFPRNTSRKEKSLAKRTLSQYEYREFDAEGRTSSHADRIRPGVDPGPESGTAARRALQRRMQADLHG